MATDRALRSSGKGSWLYSMGTPSTLVSRYGYTEDSENRGCADFGVCAGSRSGMGSGASAVRSARAAKPVSVLGRVVSPILLVLVSSIFARWCHRVAVVLKTLYGRDGEG
jgi:hypothetical protein